MIIYGKIQLFASEGELRCFHILKTIVIIIIEIGFFLIYFKSVQHSIAFKTSF